MGSALQSKTDGELLSWSRMFSELINLTPGDYGLSSVAAAEYAALNSEYSDAFYTANDASRRTTVAVLAKNMARAALRSKASLLIKVIDGTPSVTDDKRSMLGLRVKTNPVRVQPPDSAPLVRLILTAERSVSVRLFNDASEKKTRPTGATSATVFSHVGETAPGELSDWKYEGVTTTSKYEVNFRSSVANGALIWIAAFWSNDRMQPGPLCRPVSLNIAGGGVSMAA